MPKISDPAIPEDSSPAPEAKILGITEVTPQTRKWRPGVTGRARADTFSDSANANATVMDACDTTTGWTGTPTPAVVTDRKTQGTGCLRFQVNKGLRTTSMRRNFTSDQALYDGSGNLLVDRVSVDLGLQQLAGGTGSALAKIGDILEFVMSEGVDFTGALVTAQIPVLADMQDLPSTQWTAAFFKLIVPTTGLTKIRCWGFRAKSELLGVWDTSVTGGAQTDNFYVDNFRFESCTNEDLAIASGHPIVVTRDHLTGGATQGPRPAPARSYMDERAGRVAVHGLWGIRHFREWDALAEDGSVECGAALAAAIHTAIRDRGYVEAPPKAIYNADLAMDFSRFAAPEINWRGARIFSRIAKNTPMFNFQDSYRVKMHDFEAYSCHETSTNGSSLTNMDTGRGASPAPTSSGTTKILTQYGNAVRCNTRSSGPDAGPFGGGVFYGRLPYPAFPAATRALIDAYDPKFKFGTAVVFTLSSVSGKTNNCKIGALDTVNPDELHVEAYPERTNAEMDRLRRGIRQLTVSTTPTDYVFCCTPADPERAITMFAMATRDDDDITVHAVKEYNPTFYDSTLESGSCISASRVSEMVVHDAYAEGFTGDFTDISDGLVNDLHIYNFESFAMGRQGTSFNYIQRVRCHDFRIANSARSLIDIEPFTALWTVQHAWIYNGRLVNPGSGVCIASGPSAPQVKKMVLRNLVFGGTPLQAGAEIAHYSGLTVMLNDQFNWAANEEQPIISGVDAVVNDVLVHDGTNFSQIGDLQAGSRTGPDFDIGFHDGIAGSDGSWTLVGTPFTVVDFDDYVTATGNIDGGRIVGAGATPTTGPFFVAIGSSGNVFEVSAASSTTLTDHNGEAGDYLTLSGIVSNRMDFAGGHIYVENDSHEAIRIAYAARGAKYRSNTVAHSAVDLSTTGLAVAVPAGLEDGDVVYIWCGANRDTATVFAASGFTSVGHVHDATQNDRTLGLLRKKITNAAGEGSSWTVTNAGLVGASNVCLEAVAIQGVDGTTMEDVAVVTAFGVDDFTPNGPSATAVTVGSEFMTGYVASMDDGVSGKSVTAPSGCTTIASTEHTVAGTLGTFLAVAHKRNADSFSGGASVFNPGAWGSATNDATSEWAAITVVVRAIDAGKRFLKTNVEGQTGIGTMLTGTGSRAVNDHTPSAPRATTVGATSNGVDITTLNGDVGDDLYGAALSNWTFANDQYPARCVVETNLGRNVIEYTGKVTSGAHRLTAVKHIDGPGGNLFTGGYIRQNDVEQFMPHSTVNYDHRNISNKKVAQYEVLTAATAWTTGDGKGWDWVVPDDWSELRLRRLRIECKVASSSGIPTVQLHNVEKNVDMLTTRATIDVGETTSRTAAVPLVIDTANNEIEAGEHIRFDIDIAGTGTLGLRVVMEFN